jgi:hypothetical protein
MGNGSNNRDLSLETNINNLATENYKILQIYSLWCKLDSIDSNVADLYLHLLFSSIFESKDPDSTNVNTRIEIDQNSNKAYLNLSMIEKFVKNISSLTGFYDGKLLKNLKDIFEMILNKFFIFSSMSYSDKDFNANTKLYFRFKFGNGLQIEIKDESDCAYIMEFFNEISVAREIAIENDEVHFNYNEKMSTLGYRNWNLTEIENFLYFILGYWSEGDQTKRELREQEIKKNVKLNKEFFSKLKDEKIFLMNHGTNVEVKKKYMHSMIFNGMKDLKDS